MVGSEFDGGVIFFISDKETICPFIDNIFQTF